MFIKLLLIMGTAAVFGRCRATFFESKIPAELFNRKENI